jgi:hypothetical protein
MSGVQSMRKKLLSVILVLFFICTSLSAAKFNSNENLKMVTTEHFDIIYNDESSLLASQIKDICEISYSEICETYDIKEGMRFPVIVSADIEQFNSYFQYMSPLSIVIFDTVVTNDQFNVFGTNNMANVFRHELTHALTLTKVDSLTSRLFNFDFSLINANSFQKEGVTVFFESINGEGRLNDPLENSKLIEAKAEGTFPSYQEASVPRSLYTNGNYYLYGSTFYEYLINTYGIDKFNEYYKKLLNFNWLFIFPEYTFNHTYPEKLMDVWNDYKNNVPSVDIDDYLIIENLSEIPYLSLIDDDDNIYALNSRYSSVSKFDIASGELVNVLDISSNTRDVNVNDGVITVSGINIPADFSNPNTTYTTVSKNGKNIDLDISSFRNSVYLDGNIVGVKNEGEVEYLQWMDLEGNVLRNFYLPKNEAIQRISVDDDDNLIFTSRYLDNSYISRLTERGRDTIKIDSGVSIHGLSIYNNKVVLSTVKKDELAKLTIVDFENKTIKTMQETILGGVYYPIIQNDNQLYFIRRFYSGQSFSTMDINQLTFNIKSVEVTHSNSISKVDDTRVTIDGATKYDGVKYLFNNISPSLNILVIPELILEKALTINFSGTDPISQYSESGSITGEYSDEEKALIVNNTFVYNMNNNQYSVQIDGKLNWDLDNDFSSGFETQLGWSTDLDLKMNRSLNYGLNLDFDFSNGNYYSTYYQANFYADDNGIYTYDFINSNFNKLGATAFSTWSYNKNCGINSLNYFSLSTSLSSSFNYYLDKYHYYDISSSTYSITTEPTPSLSLDSGLKIHLPYLIPNINNRIYTYDLPTTIQAVTSYNVFATYLDYIIDVNTTLFSYNLEEAYHNHIPLYYRSFNVELGYAMGGKAGFGPNNVGSTFRTPSSFIYANTYVSVSPTSTSLASSVAAKIGATIIYNQNEDKPWKVYFLFDTQLI